MEGVGEGVKGVWKEVEGGGRGWGWTGGGVVLLAPLIAFSSPR